MSQCEWHHPTLPSSCPALTCPVLQVRLFTGIMFSDQPVQAEDRIFGGRYKDIRVECDPPQKVRGPVTQNRTGVFVGSHQ